MLALVLTVPAGEAELASDALWTLGVLAVEERDVDAADAGHPGGSSGIDALTWVELWTSLGDDADEIARAAEAFPKRWRWRIVEIDPSVADTWREHARPTWVEHDLVVRPAWVELDDLGPVVRGDSGGTLVIAIEPGSTFGLGDHPTTVLSLRALRRAVFHGATVLDVGAGSGVLAVAAAHFGAVRCDAIDISPASPAVVEANALDNGVSGVVRASTTPLADVGESYDVVVANILAPTLVELADDLRRVTADDGVLVVSGVLADRHDHVTAALAPMHLVDRATSEGWAALTFRW
jgi:ribosomal protein L11 methyltransferase